MGQKKKSSSFRWALATVIGSILVLALGALWAADEVLSYPDQRHAGKGAPVAVEIPAGAKFPDVAAKLAAAGVIERPTWFRLYAMHRGLANRVRAGKYELRDDLTPEQVLDTLVKGVQEQNIEVTIPEGRHLREVFALIAAAGVADAAELEKVARDPAFLRDHGIAGETAEGYLFPDTYRFKVPTPPAVVVDMLVSQHQRVYRDLREKNAKRLAKLQKDLGWGDREVVIMASIVEKETGVPDERPIVASVFFNRLLSPSFTSRRLETDPTIRYGCTIPLEKSAACREWDNRGRLFRKQLDDKDNLYNTYQHAGLPPGPIANPGREALAATMNPKQTDYFYFVAKDDRSHVFSKTYEEHTKWVDKYQR
jgi:UPF0755 protein